MVTADGSKALLLHPGLAPRRRTIAAQAGRFVFKRVSRAKQALLLVFTIILFGAFIPNYWQHHSGGLNVEGPPRIGFDDDLPRPSPTPPDPREKSFLES